ncbi:MAG: cache domain-containing protein [Desulfobacteraceae bacterium]|jgi:PAS domain S-box-containing protein|nr:cache domain-containing protein [Desulfobacteraceae bacterium]
MKNNKPRLSALILKNMMFIAVLSIGLFSILWTSNQYTDFKTEVRQLREDYIASKKNLLKFQVENVVDYIRYMKNQTEKRLKLSIKERVYEAHQIASGIYLQNRDLKSDDEIKKMIKDALRPIRFHSGRGYFFAVSMDGVEQLYPVRPEFEGKNLLNLQDAKGNFVIQDEIKIIQESGEGFVQDYWPKPDKNPETAFLKISFIKYFEPLGWYLGTGEYLDDVTQQIQSEVIRRIVDLRFDAEGYFFASTYAGDPLLSNGKITKGTNSIWNLTDPNGVKIIRNQYKAAQNPDGGFVSYHWQKLNSKALSPKISFVIGIPDWEWIVGAGSYLDTIEQIFVQKKAALKKDLINKLLKSFFILLVLLLVCVLWARRISDRIQSSLSVFSSFFKAAANRSVIIDSKELHFLEFVDIAESANTMLSDRIGMEKKLQEKEATTRALLDIPDVEIILVDPKGICLDANVAAAKRFNKTVSEIVGKPVKAIQTFPVSVEKKRKFHFITALQSKQVVRFEDKVYGKNYENIFKPLLDDQGNVSGILIFMFDISERKKNENEREQLIINLKKALSEVKTLKGLLPICSHCKKIRDDKGYWGQIESYISRFSDAEFSHSICPDCADKYYPDLALYDD